MRILSKKALKELVLYSPQHVARLEKAGLFPKRVQLGPNRVGWVESEVLDWLELRLTNREYPNKLPCGAGRPDCRQVGSSFLDERRR